MSLPRRALLGASLALPALGARAQAWPNRAIRFIVPSVTGGYDPMPASGATADGAAGQPVVMDNRPGANGNIGMQEVSARRPMATPSCSPLSARWPSMSASIAACRSTRWRTLPRSPVRSPPHGLGGQPGERAAQPARTGGAGPCRTRQAGLCAAERGDDQPPYRRGLQAAARARHPRGAVSRHAAGAVGCGGGTRAGDGGQPRRRLGAYQRRPAAAAGGDLARTLAAGTRGADRRSSLAWTRRNTSPGTPTWRRRRRRRRWWRSSTRRSTQWRWRRSMSRGWRRWAPGRRR